MNVVLLQWTWHLLSGTLMHSFVMTELQGEARMLIACCVNSKYSDSP